MKMILTEAQLLAKLSRMIIEKHDPEHVINLMTKYLKDMNYLSGAKTKLTYGPKSQSIIYNKEV